LIEHNSFTPVEMLFDPVQAIIQIIEMLETQLQESEVRILEDFDESLKQPLFGDVDRI